MEDFNLSTALLSGMEILEQLSDSRGVRSFLVRRTLDGKEFYLKAISIPESQTQIDGLRLTGAIETDDDARAYYKKVADNTIAELTALEKLSAVTNIAAFDAHELKEKEDGIGYDLYLIAEKKQTLEQYLAESPMTQRMALALALDLCGALADLRKAGFMHCNLKPSNILLNSNGHFTLSDLGLFKVAQLQFASYPLRLLSSWSAPELFGDLAPMNETQDVYAVGMMLYFLYNGGHAPFEDERTSASDASAQRLAGLPFPVPLYADYEMAEMILKACAFKPEDRYASPEELKQALTDYVERNEITDALIVPPIVTDEETQVSADALEEEIEPIQFAKKDELGEEFIEHFSPDTDSLNEIVTTIQSEIAEETAEPEPEAKEAPVEETPAKEPSEEPIAETPKKRLPVWLWILLGVAALAAAAVVLYFVLTPNVSSAEAIDVTVDSFTVAVASEPAGAEISAQCVDAYRNRFDGVWEDGQFTFTGLNPGTQYSVRFLTTDGRMTRGLTSMTVTTSDSTEVLFFNAKPIAESQVELTFGIYGPDSEQWTVSYTENGAEKHETFTGHSLTLTGLAADTQYTFTLTGDGERELTGTTTASFDTTVSVTNVRMYTEFDNAAKTLGLRWEYEGEAPTEWTLLCTGESGETVSQAIPGTAANISNLTEGEIYTIELYCPGMASAVKKVIHTSGVPISDLAAQAEDSGVRLSWTSDADAEWLISCTPDFEGALPETFTTTETSILLTGLIPECGYSVTVEPSDGSPAIGINSLTLETEKAVKFASYGCTSVYMGLFLEPSKENWTARDLLTRRDSYTASEGIAFAVQALSTLKKSEDSVTATVVLTGADGKIVSCDTKTAAWNDLWSGNLFVGAVSKTPQAAGSYTLSVYFNGQFVASKTLTVK